MTLMDLLFALFVVPVLVLAVLAASKGRHWSGAWLLTLAPLFLPMAEDGFLAVWYALATPQLDPHGIAGVVEPHAAGHVLGAGVSTILLGILAAWIARRPLRRGETWAWKALLVIGTVVVTIGVVELLFFCGHGLRTTGT
ncbi:MAG: hypothetical protein GEU73_16870, partial [Chloroflexi bacterium]|nr:hypothetical protein [Chloroflexota bacterium]